MFDTIKHNEFLLEKIKPLLDEDSKKNLEVLISNNHIDCSKFFNLSENRKVSLIDEKFSISIQNKELKCNSNVSFKEIVELRNEDFSSEPDFCTQWKRKCFREEIYPNLTEIELVEIIGLSVNKNWDDFLEEYFGLKYKDDNI